MLSKIGRNRSNFVFRQTTAFTSFINGIFLLYSQGTKDNFTGLFARLEGCPSPMGRFTLARAFAGGLGRKSGLKDSRRAFDDVALSLSSLQM